MCFSPDCSKYPFFKIKHLDCARCDKKKILRKAGFAPEIIETIYPKYTQLMRRRLYTDLR